MSDDSYDTYTELMLWAEQARDEVKVEDDKRRAREAEAAAQKEAEGKQRRIEEMRKFLEYMHLSMIVEEEFIRFGNYELRITWSRYSDWTLEVWAPAPYDLREGDEWDGEPIIKKGEMADARISLGSREHLSSWLLAPKTNFPPDIKPHAATEKPVYVAPPPPTSAERLLSLIREIISDEVDGRFERLEESIDRVSGSLTDRIDKRGREINDLRNRIDYP